MRLSWKTRIVLVVLAGCGVALVFAWPFPGRQRERSTIPLSEIPFNGERAYGYLKELCELGPRPSGSPGMAEQQRLLQRHFEALGGEVEWQTFRHKSHPKVDSFANLIVRWHPRAKERVLLCAHYDTRPFPDRDPKNPRGTFIGANDGASGVAVLMELANEMRGLKTNLGVDFVLFDAEEYVFTEGKDEYCLGSDYFARKYASDAARPFEYKYGVVLDMIGDANLEIYKERNSVRSPRTRALVKQIWDTADRLGLREFHAEAKYEINDDHVPLIKIAKIAACDIIDFDYPYWHKEADTPDKCSAESLAKVGWVIKEWLKTSR